HSLAPHSLAEPVAVSDRDARVVDVNAAWRHFARENKLAPELLDDGSSYLDLLEATSAVGGRQATEAARGVLKVLGGRQASLRIEYPMRAGDRERRYVMRVTRLENTRRLLFVCAHFDITEPRH